MKALAQSEHSLGHLGTVSKRKAHVQQNFIEKQKFKD